MRCEDEGGFRLAGPYTLKRLTDVDDSALEFGYADNQEARFATKDLDAEQTGVSHHRVKPGKRQGFAHRHDDAEEVYVVVGGSGRVKLDDEIVELGRLDAIRVAPQVTRQFEAGPDGLELIACGPRHEGDGEIVPGWWAD
jgi:mannose-6-phosphate isomerase-like protein (cupin superfamily)